MVAGRLVLQKLHLKLPDFFLEIFHGFPASSQLGLCGMAPGKSQQKKNKGAQKKRSSYYPAIVNRPRILKREKTQLDSEHLRGYLKVLNEEKGYKTAYDEEKKSFYVFHRLFEKRFR